MKVYMNSAEEPAHSPGKPDSPNVCTAYLFIRGMKYPECAVRVHEALMNVGGVFKVGVAPERDIAAAVYHTGQATPGNLLTAVAEINCAGQKPYSAEIRMLVEELEEPI